VDRAERFADWFGGSARGAAAPFDGRQARRLWRATMLPTPAPRIIGRRVREVVEPERSSSRSRQRDELRADHSLLNDLGDGRRDALPAERTLAAEVYEAPGGLSSFFDASTSAWPRVTGVLLGHDDPPSMGHSSRQCHTSFTIGPALSLLRELATPREPHLARAASPSRSRGMKYCRATARFATRAMVPGPGLRMQAKSRISRVYPDASSARATSPAT